MFESDRDGTLQIYVMNTDGSNIVRLTNRPGESMSAAVSPDGRTAFVRPPRKIARPHERLTVIEGDPRDAGQLRAALPGHDAVLSALGGPDKPRFLGLGANGSGPTTVCGALLRTVGVAQTCHGLSIVR
jgi:putative NAD(P)-binding protein/WD40 repeat protein